MLALNANRVAELSKVTTMLGAPDGDFVELASMAEEFTATASLAPWKVLPMTL